MRPVNLIPADERRSSRAPVRTGPIAYLLIGALALGLAAVTLLVLTNNKIADKKSEIADLQQREAAATAQAQQYAPFTNFASLQQSRQATVKSLANSRFDWERVMRELSLVIPNNVWLVHLTGSAGGASSSSSTTTAPTDTSLAGPSLQIIGCAADQDAVAGFLSALRDIDGVTRVGLTRSERQDEGATTSAASGGGDAASGDSASGGGSEECRTKDPIPQFEITVAFDNAPTSPDASTTAPAPATSTPPGGTTTTPSTTPSSTTTTSTTPSTPAPTGTPASSTTP
jgi:Tfp pilus assembly protein PilN